MPLDIGLPFGSTEFFDLLKMVWQDGVAFERMCTYQREATRSNSTQSLDASSQGQHERSTGFIG